MIFSVNCKNPWILIIDKENRQYSEKLCQVGQLYIDLWIFGKRALLWKPSDIWSPSLSICICIFVIYITVKFLGASQDLYQKVTNLLYILDFPMLLPSQPFCYLACVLRTTVFLQYAICTLHSLTLYTLFEWHALHL